MIEPAISIIGSGADEAAFAARAVLAGNGVAHRWLDTDEDPIGRMLRERAGLGTDTELARSRWPADSAVAAGVRHRLPTPRRPRRR